MDTLFDLSKVKKLVEDKHAQAVIIIDTNIFMNSDTPAISDWKSTLNNPVFILSDIVMAEIVMTCPHKGYHSLS
ncbi:unnamed protein product [marine sediment metagenome]|uniref:PIN domain-containing protein n=1 Tax=marine sediment metagenome TaxID=412755 RepID=X1DWS5_9ZZZZ